MLNTLLAYVLDITFVLVSFVNDLLFITVFTLLSLH